MSVSVKWTSDDADLDASRKKQEEGFDRIRAAERRARVEAAELNRLVKSGSQEAESATQRWRRQTDLLRRSLKDGSINQEEFNSAVRRADRELDQAGEKADAMGDAIRRGTAAFAGFFSATAVLGAVRALFSDIRREAEEAAESIQAAITDLGQLQQIAATPEQFRERLGLAARFQETGAFDRAGAARAAFTFESIGVDTSPFLGLARQGVVAGESLEELGRAVATIRKNFETLGSEADILSKGFAAAQESPGNIQQILAAASGIATSAEAFGIRGEEALAAISTLSEVLKSVSESETRLNRLFTAAERRGVTGSTVGDLLSNLQQAIEKQKTTPIEFLGSKEALEAFRLLRDNAEKFDQILESVATAADRDVLGSRLGLAGTAPEVQAALTLRQAQAAADIAETEIGTRDSLNKAIAELQNAIDIERGRFAITRSIAGANRRISRFFGEDLILPRELIAGLRREASEGDNEQLRLLVEQLADAVEQLRRLNEADTGRVAIPSPGT